MTVLLCTRHVYNNPVKYQDPSGHDAYCYDVDYNSCDQWMYDAVEILRTEGGVDGARLAALFDQWANDPTVLLQIFAVGGSASRASIWMTPTSDDWLADITIGADVVTRFRRSEIALLGHELEHLSQGAWQAWSIQGEIMAYQVEYSLRDSMGVGQSDNTRGAAEGLPPNNGAYDPYSLSNLSYARNGGFLDNSPSYDVPWEPTLPWGSQIGYFSFGAINSASIAASDIYNIMEGGVENLVNLVTNFADLVSH